MAKNSSKVDFTKDLQGRILVVDDSATIRASIGFTLPENFTIIEAQNGSQAWHILQEDELIDLVITDLDMPELNGYDLIRKIRDSDQVRLKSIPIIVLTGKEDTQAKQKAFKVGASDFVPKKADTVELVARIRVHRKLANIIRDLESSKHSLKQQAETDSLTGLMNRRCFMKEVNALQKQSKLKGSHFSIIMLDIDHFKKINDTYGHPAGDFVLKELAKVLTNNIRDNDILARIGGEEFCIAAPNNRVLSSVVLAERLRNAVQANFFKYNDRNIAVTISLGIATTDRENQASLENLMDIADQRLYIAKWKGRNRLCVSGSEMQNEQILNSTKNRPTLDQAITMIKHGNYDSILEHLDYILKEMIPAFEMANKLKTGCFDVDEIKKSIESLDIDKILEIKKSPTD